MYHCHREQFIALAENKADLATFLSNWVISCGTELSDDKDIVTGGGFCNSLGAKSSVHGDWLTDWLTEYLYYDIWQTADEITVDMYINVIVCTAKSSLQYTVYIIELVWIIVQ